MALRLFVASVAQHALHYHSDTAVAGVVIIIYGLTEPGEVFRLEHVPAVATSAPHVISHARHPIQAMRHHSDIALVALAECTACLLDVLFVDLPDLLELVSLHLAGNDLHEHRVQPVRALKPVAVAQLNELVVLLLVPLDEPLDLLVCERIPLDLVPLLPEHLFDRLVQDFLELHLRRPDVVPEVRLEVSDLPIVPFVLVNPATTRAVDRNPVPIIVDEALVKFKCTARISATFPIEETVSILNGDWVPVLIPCLHFILLHLVHAHHSAHMNRSCAAWISWSCHRFIILSLAFRSSTT